MSKNPVLVLIIILIILSLLLYINKDVIFQEGNPLPVLRGILRLSDETTFVKINDNPVTYITKTNDKDDLFGYIEKENNVQFKEQAGSGFIFEGTGKRIIMNSRQYTRYYQVWKYSEQKMES